MVTLSPIFWKPAFRIIPSCFPPVGLFDRVAAPEDVEAVIALENMTNDRLRTVPLLKPEERISGPGSSVIMAAFTHLNPLGSRFSDGSYGVFYASSTLETAIAETSYHRAKFLAATNERPMEFDMRVYALDIKGDLHDIAGQQQTYPALYHPTDYSASQHFAVSLRKEHSAGIVYSSVRDENGTNVAVFTPKLLSNCRQERHLCYVWDGERIKDVYQKQFLEKERAG